AARGERGAGTFRYADRAAHRGPRSARAGRRRARRGEPRNVGTARGKRRAGRALATHARPGKSGDVALPARARPRFSPPLSRALVAGDLNRSASQPSSAVLNRKRTLPDSLEFWEAVSRHSPVPCESMTRASNAGKIGHEKTAGFRSLRE